MAKPAPKGRARRRADADDEQDAEDEATEKRVAAAADDEDDEDDEDDDEEDDLGEDDLGEDDGVVIAPAEGDGGVAAAEPDVDEIDDFWAGGQVHDLVGGEKRRRRGRDKAETGGGLGWGDDSDALVVDLSGRRAETGDDDSDDGEPGRSGRRRGGRRRR